MWKMLNSATGDRVDASSPGLTRSIAHLIFSLFAFGFGLLASLVVLSVTIPALFIGWVWHTLIATRDSILRKISLKRRLAAAFSALFSTDYTTTMSPHDAFWYQICKENNQSIIVGFLEFKGEHQPSPKEIKSALNTKIVIPYARFHSRVVPTKWGPKFSSYSSFDINDHIEVVSLIAPEGKTEEEVTQNYINENIQSKVMDRSRPLWEAYIIRVGQLTTLVVRIHHCIADGMALMSVLLSLTEPVDRSSPRKVYREKVDWKKRLLTLPISLYHLIGMVTTPSDPISALKPHQRLGTPKFSGRAATIKLEDIKKIGAKYSVTVNDVITSIVSGALSKYLGQTEGRSFDIHAMVPFNLRQLTSSPSSELTNKFSLLNLKLPMGVMSDQERIKIVHSSMKEMKESLLPSLNYFFTSLSTHLPGELFENMITFFCNKTTLVFTNVMGPNEPIKLSETKNKIVSNLGFWAPQAGQVAAGISICSYNGKVLIGFSCDRKTIPDGDRLLELIDKEFEKMLTNL